MLKSAADGTSAVAPLIPASIVTSALPAAKSTKRKIVMALSEAREQSELGALRWKQPKWSRGFLWVRDASPRTPSTSFTEIASPLPHVPTAKLHNIIPNTTIASHPHLFKIVTPVKVDRLEQLLASHPNQALVRSVCCSFHKGFWPFANFTKDAPDTWDNSAHTLEGNNLKFALQQRDEEIREQRFSPSFSPDLLLGMYNMPIGVVPKPHSSSL